MSLGSAPRRRTLLRGAAVGAVVLTSGLLGVPAVSAAEDDRTVITLDPPDVGVLLIPQENGEMGWLAAGEDNPAAAAMAEATGLVPEEVAGALAAQGGSSTQSHGEEGAVDVTYGGTLVVTLPALVDASNAEWTLDLEPPDADDPPKTYQSDAPLPADLLLVTPLGGNEFSIALPAATPPYGDGAILTVDRMETTQAGTVLASPLFYFLEFTSLPPDTVSLTPSVGIFAHAVCSITAEEACPGPSVAAGEPIDLEVPPTSLLTTFGYGQLDTAVFALESASEEGPWESYDSETEPSLVTVHGPSAATMNVPAEAPSGPYYGMVVEGDPTTGFATTFFEFEVPEVAVNPGLHSDTGWVEEVREVSPGSTAAVAGGALLLVSGLVGVAAVRPVRRPPLGG